MKEIRLTKGVVAIVDDSDYAELSRHAWYASKNISGFYAARSVPDASGRNRRCMMHRYLVGAKPGQIVDHANGNTLDNRRCNLRIATFVQNCRNRKIAPGNTTGFKGVGWQKEYRHWRARIKVNGRRITIGYFNTTVEAAIAYNEAAKKYFGEFAWLNKIPEGGA